MSSISSTSHTAENIVVGIFGAFIGGSFLSEQFSGVKPTEAFDFSSLLMAVAGALVLLALLQLMRKLVGPMRKSVSKKKRDY
ncbi:MAG: GlsB/YeaQ/YmgE family stress response membrane protein [Brachymonas sp.]|nr:GlsB/YeaQ/YmgE family stress response membrane protein [Brachymonas sp.]NJS35237.1 GlsB/YeaQ/YmgE family stress response membrane protein [Brachymonas sp.]